MARRILNRFQCECNFMPPNQHKPRLSCSSLPILAPPCQLYTGNHQTSTSSKIKWWLLKTTSKLPLLIYCHNKSHKGFSTGEQKECNNTLVFFLIYIFQNIFCLLSFLLKNIRYVFLFPIEQQNKNVFYSDQWCRSPLSQFSLCGFAKDSFLLGLLLCLHLVDMPPLKVCFKFHQT